MRAVGPSVIVVVHPGFGDGSGFLEAGEPVLVQAFIPEPAVEAFAGPVLHGFPRLDEVVVDATLMAPLVEGPARELRPVVRQYLIRAASLVDDPVQHTRHPEARKAGVHLDGQALPGEGVHDVEGADAPSIGQSVRGEVHGPLLIRAHGRVEFLSWAAFESFPDPLPHS